MQVEHHDALLRGVALPDQDLSDQNHSGRIKLLSLFAEGVRQFRPSAGPFEHRYGDEVERGQLNIRGNLLKDQLLKSEGLHVLPTDLENVEDGGRLVIDDVDLRLKCITLFDRTPYLLMYALAFLQDVLGSVRVIRQTILRAGVLGSAARGRHLSRSRHPLCEDVRAEEKPVVDVEGLHGVAQIWIRAAPLEEEHQLGLVEPDVVHVLERIVDVLARHLVEKVVVRL